MLGAIGLAPSRVTAAAVPLPENARIVLPGHGWGHGRGMGQWGAKGLADQGKSYTTILSTYYSGATLGTRTATEDIRVLVYQGSAVLVTSDQPFTARTTSNVTLATSDATYKFLRVTFDGTNYVLAKATAWNGSWTTVKTTTSIIVFRPGTAKLQQVKSDGSVKIYRGSLTARYSAGAPMRAINNLTMQEYLYGVVPRESPSSWPAEELKAQAVAARTYAARKKDVARANSDSYDICSTTSCQVYGGYGSRPSTTGSTTVLEYASTNSAVDGTAGKVLTYNGSPILAEYSSSTGGYTAPGTVAYQKAVPDPGDTVSPHHDWTASMLVSEIEAKWPSIGRLVDVTVTQRNGYGQWGGRVLQMNLVGTSATVSMSGYGFMNAFEWPARSNGLQSNWFTPLYWRGALQSAPSAIAMLAGETRTITVRITNTGTASWPVGGTVRLATFSPSSFATSKWISSTRPASVTRNATDPSKSSVAPGQVAEFAVELSAATVAPGTYGQRFALIADSNSVTSLTFTVGIQVLIPWIEEAPNLLTNGSLEEGGYAWSGTNLTAGDGVTTAIARHGSHSYVIAGGTSKSISQTVAFAGGQARRFMLGAWNRSDASNASGGPIEATAVATYADGSKATWHVAFPRGAHAWTYDELAFVTHAKPLASMTVSMAVANQTGKVYFDALRLLESPVANGSFEDGAGSWKATGTGSGDGVTTLDKRDGTRSLVLQGATGTKSYSQTLAINGRRYERFLVSGWNKASAPSSTGGAIAVTLTLNRTDGTKSIVSLPFSSSAHGWTLAEKDFTSSVAFTSATVTATVSNQSGSFWFDDLRVARSWTANSTFEGGLAGWTGVNLADASGVVTSLFRDGTHALKLSGSGFQVVQQSLGLSGKAGRTFVLSGWNRNAGTTTSRGAIDVRLRLSNADGSVSWLTMPLNRSPHGWVYAERSVVAPKDFTNAMVLVVFSDQTGAAYYDGIRVASA